MSALSGTARRLPLSATYLRWKSPATFKQWSCRLSHCQILREACRQVPWIAIHGRLERT
jgi:hypothetical protein